MVCEWIGNSITVANKHYLQVTGDHFEAAAETATGKVATMVAPQGRELGRTGGNTKKEDRSKTLVLRGISREFCSVQANLAPPLGLEPRT